MKRRITFSILIFLLFYIYISTLEIITKNNEFGPLIVLRFFLNLLLNHSRRRFFINFLLFQRSFFSFLFRCIKKKFAFSILSRLKSPTFNILFHWFYLFSLHFFRHFKLAVLLIVFFLFTLIVILPGIWWFESHVASILLMLKNYTYSRAKHSFKFSFYLIFH